MCLPSTTINLPPRYVRPLDSKKSNTSEPSTATRSEVHFRLDANKVHPVIFASDRTMWYSSKDYRNFAIEWRISNIHYKNAARQRSRYSRDVMNLATGKRSKEPIPTMEELQCTQEENSESSKKFVRSILAHQAKCKAKGYTDPDGYSFLSKSLSKSYRKLAWQLAAVNAYEVRVLFERPGAPARKVPPHRPNTSSTSSFSGLLSDYYIESVHPYMSQPLVFMSKLLLCECD